MCKLTSYSGSPICYFQNTLTAAAWHDIFAAQVHEHYKKLKKKLQ